MSFIKRLMEIKEWQAENEQTQTLILQEILKVLKGGKKKDGKDKNKRNR